MTIGSFTKKEHLKKNNAIKAVFDKGISSKGRLIKVYLLKKETGPFINRAAFVIRKGSYNKKAVLRNRFKRLLREAYRKTKRLLPAGYDIVILAVNLKQYTKSIAVEKDMADVFKKYLKK